jgi:TolA-binding protein
VAEASFHVGEARAARGETDAARSLFRNALVAANPRRADVLYRLGFVELQREEYQAAAEALRALVEEHAESELVPEALFLWGEALFRLERPADAAEVLGRARGAAREPELQAKVLFRLGLALGELERWSECEAALTELAQRHGDFPNLAEAELWRGRALLAQEKGRAARGALERTIALDKGALAARARVALGKSLEAEGRSEEALSEYLKVALLYADEEALPEALFRAGGVLEALGDPAKARQQYEELVEKHPRAAQVAEALARIRALGG